MRLCTARAMLSAAGGGVAGAYQEPARSSSIRPCRPRVKIKLRASDSCERGHRRSGWALGFNVKLMAGISVPVPSVDDGAIADRLGPPSESGRELQPREVFLQGSAPPRFVLTGGGSGNAVAPVFLRGSREGWANGFHAVRERNPRSSVRHAPRNYLWPNYYSRVNSLISFTYTST
jgi:hypothetical protein